MCGRGLTRSHDGTRAVGRRQTSQGHRNLWAMPDSSPEWSTAPFGEALRAAMAYHGLSFRDLESRALVPVGNLHDHVSGKRPPPGDDLLERIARGAKVEPAYFREWRERRLIELLRDVPELELRLSRHGLAGTLGAVLQRLVDAERAERR